MLCRPLRTVIRGEEEETAAAMAIASMRHGTNDDGASSVPINGGGGGGVGAVPNKSLPVDERHEEEEEQQQVAKKSKLHLLQPPPAQEQPPTRPTLSEPIFEKAPCIGTTQGGDQEGREEERQVQQRRQMPKEKSPILQLPPPIPSQTASNQLQRHTKTPAAVGKADMAPSPNQRRSLPPSPPREMLGEGPKPPATSLGQDLHQEYEQQQQQQQQQRQPMRPFLRTLHPAAAIAIKEPENKLQLQGQTPAAMGRTGTPPPLVQSKSSKRRTSSPLAPVNPNIPPIASSVGPSQSKKPSINSPLRKRRRSLHGSVATSLLSHASCGRRDLDSLSSSRARFAKQLQARDESSTESEAPSSIDTDDSFEQKIHSVGVLVCKACAESETPIQLCQDCENSNLDLFAQAVLCQNVECTTMHCGDMKFRLQHLENCEIGFVGGCRACRFIFPLFRLHARQCQLRRCPVALCATIKSCTNCNVDATVEEKTAGVAPKPSLCYICQAILPSVLLHSAKCVDTACSQPACAEMKYHTAHWMACSEGPNCLPCRRFVAVIRAHAIECQDSSCQIASCSAAKASLFRPGFFRPGFFRAPETSPREVWL